MSDDAIKDLKARIRELISDFKPEDLVRAQELGNKLDFSSALGLFKRVIELFSRLEKSDLHLVTENQLSSLDRIVSRATSAFSSIRDFDVEQVQNAPQERDGRISTLRCVHEEAKGVVGPILAVDFAWSGGIDLDEARQQVRNALDELRNQTEEGKRQLESQLAEADGILTKIKGRSADLGITEHAILFEKAANDFSDERSRWLSVVKWVAGFATLLAIANSVWVFVAADSGTLTTAESIQVALAKIVLFSIAYYVLIWTVRMFRAAAHNEVVNRHRFRAMSTFERFTDAASDKATKDAVLLRSTESIFWHQNTGLSDSATDTTGNSRLMEIIRGLPPDNQD